MKTSADVVGMIVADHRHLEDLFERVRDDAEHRSALFPGAAALLSAHLRAEAYTVYPAVSGAHSRLLPALLDADADALQSLGELRRVPAEAPHFAGMLAELTDTIAAHIEASEGGVLLAIETGCTAADRYRLGVAFSRVQATFLSGTGG